MLALRQRLWLASSSHRSAASTRLLSVSSAVSRAAVTGKERNSDTHARTSHNVGILVQLERVAELQKRVAAENSKTTKATIIAQYPDLRELLEYIYQPTLKLHLTGKSLDKYIKGDTSKIGDDSAQSLLQLFRLLESRTIRGNDAKCACLSLLVAEDILTDEGIARPDLLDIFYRLLDRNLTAGFGANTLKSIVWESPAQLTRHTEQTAREALSPPSQTAKPVQTVNLEKFSCALGHSIDPPFNALFKSTDARWFASRKLDGIRCLTFVDFVVPRGSGKPAISSITFLSRSGNQFTSLGRLKEQLQELENWTGLEAMLARDTAVVRETAKWLEKRLVLDGEVCVMRRMTAEELSVRAEHDDGSLEADALWVSDGLTEDFQATVSQVKRQSADVQHPAYFLFDVISWAEFALRGPVPAPELGKTFSRRVVDVEEIGGFLAQQDRPLIRALAQREVRTPEDLDGMVQRAANEGWEGLVLRADTTYKGKRSRDIYKFKKWQDDEYVVVSAHISTMRLAVDGVYQEREACANVFIEHNGHPVSVGSGFSAEQRLRFARDPTEIVGKQITVEYFGESEALDRPGVMSLRFPRVKRVWEEGTRTV